MQLPSDTVTALQTMIDNDSALRAQLASATSSEQAAAILADAVQARASQQAASMDDSQLDTVSGGLTSLQDQFRGLPMSDLIGGPLNSAVDAQARLAAATSAFIAQMGFKF